MTGRWHHVVLSRSGQSGLFINHIVNKWLCLAFVHQWIDRMTLMDAVCLGCEIGDLLSRCDWSFSKNISFGKYTRWIPGGSLGSLIFKTGFALQPKSIKNICVIDLFLNLLGVVGKCYSNFKLEYQRASFLKSQVLALTVFQPIFLSHCSHPHQDMVCYLAIKFIHVLHVNRQSGKNQPCPLHH